MIPEFVLERLACPLCKKHVVLLEGGDGLKCMECRRVYRVRDGIPVMLPEDAEIDAS